jgi:molybdopterin-binding protein
MKISARNILKGTVVEIKRGQVMAEVVLDVNGQKIISVITEDAIEELALKEGSVAFAIIKSTEVLLMAE